MHLRGFCVVARETVEPTSAVHSRFFAPHFGIPEDVVTGSVHSPMAAWLYAAGVVPGTDGRAAFTAEQGDGLGRPGRLSLEVDLSGESVTRVRIGGAAVTVLRGVIRVP